MVCVTAVTTVVGNALGEGRGAVDTNNSVVTTPRSRISLCVNLSQLACLITRVRRDGASKFELLRCRGNGGGGGHLLISPVPISEKKVLALQYCCTGKIRRLFLAVCVSSTTTGRYAE